MEWRESAIRESIARFVGAAEVLLFEIMCNRDWQESERIEVINRLVKFMRDPWSGLGMGDTARKVARELLETMNKQGCQTGITLYRKAWEATRQALSQYLEGEAK